MAQKILIADDEPKMLKLAAGYLEAAGFSVATARDGRQALEQFRKHAPDCVILDIMMPNLDGLEAAREILKNSDTPIIFLTARSAETDRVVGLELGADDYVVKPFSPRELTARVKAVLRRAQKPAEESGKPICIGEMTIDPERFEVTCHGQAISLTATEFRIVLALAQSAGRVFSRQQLLERAMDMAYEGYDRTIDAHIKNIRHKLSVASSGKGCNITTVQGVGYKLEEARCAED
jgi:DNA-binding response OmpR family regulator